MQKEIEYNFAKKILEHNNEIHVIFNDQEPYTLYKARDIGRTLGIKNVNEKLKYETTEKQLLKSKTKGGDQNCIFINYNDTLEVLLNSRKPQMIELCKKLDINIKSHVILQYETETLKYIIDAFENEEIILQYSIDKYFLDLYFPSYYLIIECDEYEHKYNKIEDKEREDNIKLLIPKCHFIRFSPCDKDFNIFKVINKIYVYISNFKSIHLDINIEKIKLERDEVKLQQTEKQLLQTDKMIEIKKIELEIVKNKTNEDLSNKVNQLYEKIKELETEKEPDEKSEEYESDDDDVDLTKIYFSTKSKKDSIRTPFVYQYNLNDLCNPIKIYNSPSEVERSPELKHLEISPSPLRNSSKNNTIYKGYRWYFAKRNEIPPIIIPETVENKHKEPEIKFIAMIDITKTKILNVYPNQKEATKARLMKCNSFSRAIKEGTISSGHYWNYFEDCSKEMQDEYLKTNKLPEKYTSKCSKAVEQICPKTKKVLKTYHSSREVIKEFQMSVMSLKKYNDSGEIHNGYIWKIVG